MSYDVKTSYPCLPFQKVLFKDAIRFNKTIQLVMHYTINDISYATTCDFKNSGDFHAPHSLCKLLEKFNPYVAELWNMRSKSVFLLVEDTACKYILIVPPNIIVSLSNSDATYKSITLYIYCPLPTICNTYYTPCLSFNTWINYNNMSLSNISLSNMSLSNMSLPVKKVVKRASTLPDRLNTITEDDISPGSDIKQISESVHDGNCYALAMKTNSPRCPNERRHFRLMDESHY